LHRTAPLLTTLTLFLVTILGTGCAALATQRLGSNLSHAMLNQNDPATVRTGATAYLLLIDGLIEGQPRDRTLLITGAKLYNAYAGGLAEDETRARRLTEKARGYARRAMCGSRKQACEAETQPFEQFQQFVAGIQSEDIDALYTYGICWAGWIAARSGDWSALADLPKVEAVLERVIALDPGYARGRAQLYLGVMHTQLPPAMGGNPERGRGYFERAIEYSGGRDLIAKVEFARNYARLVFDRELHDRLLKEVLAADPVEPDLTLSNVLAQEQAKKLLAEDYFP
jgi:hypothetical protein